MSSEAASSEAASSEATSSKVMSSSPPSPNNQLSQERMLKLLQLVLAASALWAASAAVTGAEARTCLRGPNCWYWPRAEGRIVRYYPQHQAERMRVLAERRAANHHGGGW